MQNVNIIHLNLAAGPDSLQIFIEQTLCLPELEFIFESKVETQLESVCKSFAHIRKKKFFCALYHSPTVFWPKQNVLGREQDKQMKGPMDYYHEYKRVFGGNVLDFL